MYTRVHVYLLLIMQASVRLSSKLSQSSAAIIDQKPVTADDLDDVLRGLAKFNMENSRSAILYPYIIL